MADAASIWRVSYQKGMQIFKFVIAIWNMTRFPLPFSIGANQHVIAGNDYWWAGFSFIALACTSGWVLLLSGIQYSCAPFLIIYIGGMLVHGTAVHSVCYWHRESYPYRLIGAKAKLMIEVIPMIVAAAIRVFTDDDRYLIILLLGCTSYFYSFAHFLHVAYDIGGKDIFLGLSMLLLVHRLSEKLLVGASALSFCLCLSFYRYMTYCAPELPIHPTKKELPV
ncbi:uncharacterized protein LOC132066741 [Lycium ferocissimum]|uniref:uncharacterized protein LOC132066741 n=1 Tax=Lycium ferocissimum TaxID=112874 RepID=UPI002815B257|nr:uncharacterized protein LOC132066741 [Lycium ferocissimum]